MPFVVSQLTSANLRSLKYYRSSFSAAAATFAASHSGHSGKPVEMLVSRDSTPARADALATASQSISEISAPVPIVATAVCATVRSALIRAALMKVFMIFYLFNHVNGLLVIDFGPEEMLDYLRKSRSDDPLLTVEEVLSKHETILDEWAEKHLGKKIPEENKYREVVSGETLKDCPEVQELLRRIESPRIRAVAVVEPQRLTRGDLEDIGRLMKLFKHTDTLIVTPERIYDLRDDYDWEAFERELKRGNDYLEYSKKILNRGKLLSVSQGNYIGSIPPFGYDKDTVLDA